MLKRYAIIENSKVVNVVESESAVDGFNMVLIPDDFGIGDDFDGTNFIKQPQVVIEPPIITVISMRQARLQLLSMNLLDAVNAQISAMSQAAQIEWEYATEVQRSNPLVSALQSALSMTDSDMDLFFSDANLL
jgi:hypothetical protein